MEEDEDEDGDDEDEDGDDEDEEEDEDGEEDTNDSGVAANNGAQPAPGPEHRLGQQALSAPWHSKLEEGKRHINPAL